MDKQAEDLITALIASIEILTNTIDEQNQLTKMYIDQDDALYLAEVEIDTSKPN
jgi:hypothetical protein